MAVQFKIQISKIADFSKASNFIYKVTEREGLNSEETENVCFMQVSPDPSADIGRTACRNVLIKEAGFQTIHQPEKIHLTSLNTRIIFTLCINETDFKEIVSYQNVFLLVECYRDQEIYVLITGSSEFYYKLSQYLAFALDYCSLRGHIFYKDLKEQNVKRLQERSLELSTAFFPLMVINEKSIQDLRDKCSAKIGKKALEIIEKTGLKEKSLPEAVDWKELGGVLKILSDGSRNLLDVEDEFILELIRKTDVLPMIFLAYLLRGIAQTEEHRAKKEKEKKRKIGEKELAGYIELMQQYANACYQLLENIIFHSDAGWGILSVRIHKFDEEIDNGYLNENYGIEARETGYFEVSIRDFAGGRQTTDIASNFKKNLPEEDREVFVEVTPQKFFRNTWTGDNPWDQIYRKPEYIGKHFGLRIFRRILRENNGLFWAESHRFHKSREEDACGIGAARETGEYGMPGTGYDMLLPLDRKQEEAVEDVSQEYGDWLSKQPERLMTLESRLYQGLVAGQPDYSSEKEKNEKISALADRLLTFGNENSEEIFATDLSDIDEGYAEILAKGIVIAEHFMKEKRHIVFYNCAVQFRKLFCTAMLEMFEAGLENMFQEENFQLMLISEGNSQTVFVPGSAELTNGLNAYICKIRGERCEVTVRGAEAVKASDHLAEKYIPFDAIVHTGSGDTCFENYVREILDQDIQKDQFGCKITDTHMRLGSTIHISRFYEAELLFGNRYFVTRFALLILREIYPELETNKKITLYGYGIYSESLLVQIRNAVRHMGKCVDIDYIFLEREEERRGFSHTDRIRYSRRFRNLQERKEYVRDRKYILIVPINSTLKTHQRLRDLLQEENSLDGEGWILKNYALILVGSRGSNNYWKKNGKYLKCTYAISPQPQFFVEVETDYQEPLMCEKCFPADVMEEYPLIEVNAASTIPNQAFGIVDEKADISAGIADTANLIQEESRKMDELKDCLLYGHMVRNDEHYLFYLSTDELIRSKEEKIKASLDEWKKNVMKTGEYEYHILVAPMHYSNCTFVELVNDIIFDSMAMILRIDFNKDFRTNVYTKYSNIRQYIRQLEKIDGEVSVNFHFVDDSIITGRTYHRAKSLIETMAGYHHQTSDKVKIRIFDRVFTLIDRNSRETRMQYIAQASDGKDNLDTHYYSYIRMEISSLRNYGDSCVICNLHREAQMLCRTASTRIVSRYWKNGDEKFGLIPIEEALRRKRARIAQGTDEEYQKRAYRRMFCSHMLKCILDRADHRNQIRNIIRLILHVLNEDYHLRGKEEAVEYFISYLKVCSRPFLVFTKEVREAIYDILLAISEFVVKGRDISKCASTLGKRYWDDPAILTEWGKVVNDILLNLDRKEKTDLLMVCMKQLTEMKSNYIIRLENMEALFAFMNLNWGDAQDRMLDFEHRYIILIKRLTGISSDTSKGLWLDYALWNRKEIQAQSDEKYKLKGVNEDFLETVIMENSRVFRDGIQKLNMKLRNDVAARETLDEYIGFLCKKEYENLCYLHFFTGVRKKHKFESVGQLKAFLIENSSSACWLSPEKVTGLFSDWETDGKSQDEYWEHCLSGLRNSSNENKLQESVEKLKQIYDAYTENNYQFENFRKLWEELKLWEEGEENIQLTCALQIKYLCHSRKGKEEGMLGKVEKLARLSGEILNRSPHQVLIEYDDISEYYLTEVERMCEEETSDIACEKKIIEGRFRGKGSRHYCSLVEKIGTSDSMNDEIHQRLNDEAVLRRIEEYGFYYGEGVFIWKLGEGSSYPIFFFVKLVNDDKKMKYRIRNLLQFRDELENYIFDSEKPDYFHELAIVYNRLNIYKNPKSVSHDSGGTMEENFRRVLKKLNGEDAREDKQQKPSEDPVETLRFLSGMYLGRLYRQSVTKELYQDFGTGIKLYDFTWGDKKNIFQNEFTIPGKSEEKTVMIKRWDPEEHQVEFMDFDGEKRLEDEDCLLAGAKNCHEFLSLLFSLFLNANKQGRGIAEKESGCVEVYLSKTKDGMLRVTHRNHCEDITLSQIRRSLNRQPDNENNGITLWSLNSYLKRELVKTARICLRKMNVKDAENMESVLQKIGYILDPDGEFRIKPGVKKDVLWYELPFLWGKYDSVINGKII